MIPLSLHKFYRNLLVITAGLTLMACSSSETPERTFGPVKTRVAIQSIDVTVASKANKGAPLRADIVAIVDDTITNEIAQLTAAEWFVKKYEFPQEYAEKLIVLPVTVTHGQNYVIRDIPMNGQTVDKLYLFADYKTIGAHRLEMNPGAPNPRLEFRDDDVYYYE